MGEVGRNLEADIAIAFFRAHVDRAEEVGCILNVADREEFIAAFGIEIVASREGVEEVLILPSGNCLLEDGGVRCHAAQAVFGDQALQFTACHQVPANVIEPDGLAKRLKLGEGIGGFCGFKSADWIHKHLLS